MTPDDAIRRAQRAQQLLADDLFQSAFADVESLLTKAWQESTEADEEGRERLYRMLWSAKKLRSLFEVWVQDGVHAEHTIQAIKRGQF